jgi:hypothetical protein
VGIRKFSNAVTQKARARAEFEGMPFISSVGLTVVSANPPSTPASQRMRNPALYLPRNGSITLGGFNAFTEAEGDYH